MLFSAAQVRIRASTSDPCTAPGMNQTAQFEAASHHELHTAPFTAVTNRSIWPLRGASAVTVAPGRIGVPGLIWNHGCQFGPASHQVDQTVPEASVANRSMWPLRGASAVTVAPRCIGIPGLIWNHGCQIG